MPLIINYILIVIILVAGGYVAFRFFKTNYIDAEEELDIVNNYTIKHLIDLVAEEFAIVLKQNLREMNLTRAQLEAREKAKQELRESLKEAAYGNPQAKQYVKLYIRDFIQREGVSKFGISEDTINEFIPFDIKSQLSNRDKFEILMHVYGLNLEAHETEGAFIKFVDENNLLAPIQRSNGSLHYEVTGEKLNEIYDSYMADKVLTYGDKLDILSERVFADYKGFGAADILFDMGLDEIDVGVSGIPKDTYDIKQMNFDETEFSYESIWTVVHGINLKLSFLSLGSQDELMRVCNNVYKFNAPKALSKRNPKVVSTMKDGSRVVVSRPPFSDSWCFFVRKFDSMPSLEPEKVLRDENNVVPLTIIKWLIRGYCNIAVTGQQGTGKTTLLKSIITYFPEELNIRVQELAFETNLRYTYPQRNIVSFQETESVSSQEGLDLQKKTNGSCNILGEVATAEAASWLIQTSMVASLFAMFTHHAKTVHDLVIAIRNNLIDSHGGAGFQNEEAAEDMVARTINIDIHMVRVKGHRYCSRITEIIPINDRRYPSELPENEEKNLNEKATLDQMENNKRSTDRELFKSVDLVVFENGRYVFKALPSPDLLQRMYNNMTDDEEKLCRRELEALEIYRG